MKLKLISIIFVVTVALASAWYVVEPHAVTFIDDGPYYSSEFLEPVTELPISSQIELRRFGRVVYLLESRDFPVGENSVLVLKDSSGSVRWVRRPEKPDGKLGTLELRGASMTWNGGWRIRIKPKSQEGGYLYLGSFGGFRFFNHSW